MSVDKYADEVVRLAPAWELVWANEISDFLSPTVEAA